MSDFAPPTGPPPPKVPEGWKAVWNSQYNEWFYVNTYTKKSQWDKPTEPVYASPDGAPPGAPPGYDHSTGRAPGPEKFGSNNPYGGPAPNTSDDEQYARKLQQQEQERAGGNTSRGAADSYYQGGGGGPGQSYGQAPAYGQNSAPAYGQSGSSPAPPPPEKRGLFSRLTGGGRPPQQGQYGGPPQGYGGPQYGQASQPSGYPGYYPPQGTQPQYAQQQAPPKKGMGAGGMMLGAGAGLLGGALLMDAFEDHSQAEYDQGFQQGAAADDGGDYGGGDDGGFGGDDGGDF